MPRAYRPLAASLCCGIFLQQRVQGGLGGGEIALVEEGPAQARSRACGASGLSRPMLGHQPVLGGRRLRVAAGGRVFRQPVVGPVQELAFGEIGDELLRASSWPWPDCPGDSRRGPRAAASRRPAATWARRPARPPGPRPLRPTGSARPGRRRAGTGPRPASPARWICGITERSQATASLYFFSRCSATAAADPPRLGVGVLGILFDQLPVERFRLGELALLQAGLGGDVGGVGGQLVAGVGGQEGVGMRSRPRRNRPGPAPDSRPCTGPAARPGPWDTSGPPPHRAPPPRRAARGSRPSRRPGPARAPRPAGRRPAAASIFSTSARASRRLLLLQAGRGPGHGRPSRPLRRASSRGTSPATRPTDRPPRRTSSTGPGPRPGAAWPGRPGRSPCGPPPRRTSRPPPAAGRRPASVSPRRMMTSAASGLSGNFFRNSS